jgi:CheY-like chemotaxis protein
VTAPSGRKGVLLIVDDDPAVRQSLREFLITAGYDVRQAADGIQAVKQVDASPVDVVILDLVMPERDGLETLRILHKEHPGIKVIAMSEKIPGLLRIAELLGAVAGLSKPVQPETLLKLLSAALGT